MALPFSQYTPIDGTPGAYQFSAPDRPPVTLFGAPAEELRTNIDRLNASQPQPVAMGPGASGEWGPEVATDAPAPNPSVQTSDLVIPEGGGGGFGGQVPSAPPAAPQQPQLPAETVPASVVAPQPNGASGSWGPPQAQPQGPQAEGDPLGGRWLSLDKTGTRRMNVDTGLVVEVLPRGGASAADVRLAREQLTQGKENLIQYQSDAARLGKERADLEVAEYARQQEVAKGREDRARREMLHAAIEEQEVQDQLNEERAQLAKFQEEYASGKVDPDRYFSGEKGGANKLRAGLAVMFGAIAQFGHNLAGRSAQNEGLNWLMKTLDEDARQQEREIKVKGELANNMLSRIKSTTGDLNQAKLALKAQQSLIALNEGDKMALASKSQVFQNEWAQSRLAIEQQYQAALAQYDQLANLRIRALRSGGQGGVRTRPATLDEAQAAANLDKTQLGNTGEARKLSGGALPEGDAAKSLLGTFRSLGAMKNQLANDVARGGQPWTPEGQNIAGRFARGVTDAVAGEGTYKGTLSPEEKARADRFATTKQALLSIGTQLTGAGAPSEGEAIRSASGNAQTEEQLMNIIDTYQPVIAEKLKGYGVNVPKVDIRPE